MEGNKEKRTLQIYFLLLWNTLTLSFMGFTNAIDKMKEAKLVGDLWMIIFPSQRHWPGAREKFLILWLSHTFWMKIIVIIDTRMVREHYNKNTQISCRKLFWFQSPAFIFTLFSCASREHIQNDNHRWGNSVIIGRTRQFRPFACYTQ
jgi:hypothetical protein